MNIQNLYDEFERAKKGLGAASRMKRKEAVKHMLGHVSRSRARLYHAQNGTRPPTRYNADMETTVSGIPCGIIVICDIGGTCASFDGDYEASEFEFFLIDSRGHRAPWLERKLTCEDGQRIYGEYSAYMKDMHP